MSFNLNGKMLAIILQDDRALARNQRERVYMEDVSIDGRIKIK
jgi:hypothetical protein